MIILMAYSNCLLTFCVKSVYAKQWFWVHTGITRKLHGNDDLSVEYIAFQMDQEAEMLSAVGTENTGGMEEEIYCVCRSSDVSRFMM